MARTVNSTITSQTQLLEPLLTSDGVRPEVFPVNTLALNNLDSKQPFILTPDRSCTKIPFYKYMNTDIASQVQQVTALCELYSLGLTGGMEQKMQRLRMFIGIERA